MYQHGLHVKKSLIKAYTYYSVGIKIKNVFPDETSGVTAADILDSMTTLKAQMTPQEIKFGEAEIPKVMREYGFDL